MSESDELFKGSGARIAKNAFNSSEGQNKTVSDSKLIGEVLFVLAVVGAEGVRVLFRKDFGKSGINIFKVAVCALIFGSISYGLLTGSNFRDTLDSTKSTQASSTVTGILFGILALLILIKGFRSDIKAQKESTASSYNGDSDFLSFLHDFGISKVGIKLFAEPLYLTIIGVMFYFYNPVGGITITIFGLSVWFDLLFDIMFEGFKIGKMKQEMLLRDRRKKITNVVNSKIIPLSYETN